MKRSRCRNEILSQILSTCLEGAHKTQIAYQSNLNFKTMNTYLGILVENGLIEPLQKDRVLYETTSKGANLLEKVNRVNDELLGIIGTRELQ